MLVLLQHLWFVSCYFSCRVGGIGAADAMCGADAMCVRMHIASDAISHAISHAVCVRHASHAISHAICVRITCDVCAHEMRCVCASTPRSIFSSFIFHLASLVFRHVSCFVFGLCTSVFGISSTPLRRASGTCIWRACRTVPFSSSKPVA